jgi:thioredoxin reductase (NADPH)
MHRRDQLRAIPVLAQRAFDNDKIAFRWDTAVAEILADQSGVTGVRLKNLNSGAEEEFPCDGVFIAIGHQPNAELFEGQLEFDKDGYIKTRNGTETSVPGVFAAGDVQDPIFRQAVTAAGSGCMAAIQAERFLDDLPSEAQLSCQKGVCRPKP